MVTQSTPADKFGARAVAAVLCLIAVAAVPATAQMALADGPAEPPVSVGSPASPPLAQLLMPVADLGANYRVVTTWDGGEIVYATLAVPEDGVSSPAVLQEIQRLPTSAAAEWFFPEVVAAPTAAPTVFAFDIPSPGPPGSRAIKVRQAGDGSEADVIVLLARQGSYIARVELRGEDGTSRAPTIAAAGRLLDGLLARLPPEPLDTVRLVA